MTVSVTVIIPAHNAEVCLRRCLESVFGQEYLPEQVIVVNDGSTDGTGQIAARYANRIEYHEQDNLGPGAARNVGLQAAWGKYFAFLDADDYWLPGFLSKCVQFLEEHDDTVAVSVGQSHNLWGHGEVVRPLLLQDPSCPKGPFVIDNFFSFWAEHNHVVTGSCVMRRCVIEKAGGQREDFRVCEDLEYWGLLATFGKWGFIPEVFWVGDPTPAAASQGWMKKHTLRWQNLPNLDQWECRILPRLRPDDMAGFLRMRGRVAANLVHQNVLAGNDAVAKRILTKSGFADPGGQILRLLQSGIRGGAVGWYLACSAIRLRERLKSKAIHLTTRWHPKSRMSEKATSGQEI